MTISFIHISCIWDAETYTSHIRDGDRHCSTHGRRSHSNSLYTADGDTPLYCIYYRLTFTVSYTMHVSICVTQISTYKIDSILQCTCDKLMSSYSGLTEASNGYHVVNIIERLVSMRTADWVAWKTATKVHPYFARLLTKGIHPVIVKLPVSGSLFGKSPPFKDSANRMRYSISGLLNLKHKNMSCIECVYM